MHTGKELFTLNSHNGPVFSAVYSPDERIATAGEDGIVQIYTTNMDELLRIAESQVTHQLTVADKREVSYLRFELILLMCWVYSVLDGHGGPLLVGII